MNYSMPRAADVAHSIETRGRACEYLRWGLATACASVGEAPIDHFRARWPHQKSIDLFIKSAVTPMSTTGASALVPFAQHSAALVEMLRPLTVVGRMQDSFRRVPFNVLFPRVTAGGSVQWVGQGQVRSFSRLSLDQIQVPTSKVSGACVFTKELARSSDPVVEALVRSDMTDTIAKFSDEQFLNPTIAEMPDVSPASITFGATAVESNGGITGDAAQEDLKNLFAAVTSNLIAPYLIMKPTTAVALAAMGANYFPKVGANGGEIWGVPVLTSANTPTDASSPSNNLIILIDAAEVLYAEDGIEFSVARHATVQMDDAPDSPPSGTTVMVSLWQRNLVGVGVNRYVHWKRRREGAVAYLGGVQY